METNNKNCYLSLSNSMIKKEKNGYNINGENNNILYFHDGKEFRACLETHLSIMKRFNSMLAMAI